MLLIGESAMSFAHLVNGAVVNVRGRVSHFTNFINFLQYILGNFCHQISDSMMMDDNLVLEWHWNNCQGDKLGIWLRLYLLYIYYILGRLANLPYNNLYILMYFYYILWSGGQAGYLAGRRAGKGGGVWTLFQTNIWLKPNKYFTKTKQIFD